ncbi:acetate--CoA ligase family protein [Trebonia sp.]|uniref:acetate--CoA ligase family protein n=1 Tax=Trebonia sp. TaxID=2767075 RepID=UPI00260BFD92|nr:acetate--CoA ligase family protein [Trebonia sp.]
MTVTPEPAPPLLSARQPRSGAAAPPSWLRSESAPHPVAFPVREPLRALFDPRSVAVVGASDNPQKWGYWLARGALAGQHRRQVYLVNRRGATVLGSRTWPSLAELPQEPELVVVATPPGSVRGEVEQGLTAGARCFVVITAGVGEPASPRDELDLAELVRAHGARLLGPNCMGVVDDATALQLCWGAVPAGQVGLISQSGNLALEIGRLLGRAGQGLSRLVSLGNQRDIDAAEMLQSLVEHERTRVIAAYVEDFRDGRRLARALACARAAGKPVLLLAPGRSAASGRAAQSHTGALVSSLEVVDAAVAEAGALRLDTAGALVDAAVTLLAPGMRGGGRVAVVADGGGQGALAADALAAAGMSVPPLRELTMSRLRGLLPAAAGVTNPVDLAGAGESDIGSYAAVVNALLTAQDTDAVVLSGYFGDYATGSPQLADAEAAVADALAAASADAARPVVVHSMATTETPALRVLRRRGIPVFDRIEHAASAIARAARWTALAPVERPKFAVAPPAGDGGYERTRELLAGYGLSFPAARFVADADHAAAAAAGIGYPVVLKAMGLAHKTEAQGVALNLRDEAALRAAFAAMRPRTRSAAFAVEAMVRRPGSVELIMGVRQDASFGPVAIVGIGGITAELLADTAVGLAPLTRDRAHQMLGSLRQAPLLTGWRGAEPIDLAAAADALVAIARAGAEHPEYSELEVNPVLAHPGGAIALDAHGVLSAPPAAEAGTDRR